MWMLGSSFYEMMPDGQLMELSYSTVRASYARDMSRRTLLTPGKVVEIPFDRAYVFSKRVSKGSRLLLTLNLNKNPLAQINYRTGKDVSVEDIHDAKDPLVVQWLSDSYIRISI